MTSLVYMGAGERGQHKFQNAEGLQMAAYISEGIPTPTIGQAVECEIKQGTSKSGNPFTRVEAINGQRGTYRGAGGGQARMGGRPPMAYDPRTFVSNVVGQAISAGVIKEPEQVAAWAITAYKTIRSLEPAAAKTEVVDPSATPGAQAAPSAPQPTLPPSDDIPF